MTNRIRELRKEIGLNQGQLGKLVHVSRVAISNIECGMYNPNLVLAFKLADILQTPLEELFKMEYNDWYKKEVNNEENT